MRLRFAVALSWARARERPIIGSVARGCEGEARASRETQGRGLVASNLVIARGLVRERGRERAKGGTWGGGKLRWWERASWLVRGFGEGSTGRAHG
jgi:hypothetical protein